MINDIQTQGYIPVISSMKKLEQFLKTSLKVCILQDVHIALLGSMIDLLHQHHCLALVHIDMINGLSSDEHGTEYVIQRLKGDGIITVKARVIESAKKNHKTAILRIFLIDGKSLERGLDLVERVKPDVVEVMPAIAYTILPTLRNSIRVPIIAGGLLRHAHDIEQALKHGCDACSLSDLDLCVQMSRAHKV
jgi:glycerol uptake operon antiterminator